MILTAPASQSIWSGASSEVGYALTVESLVKAWSVQELLLPLHPVAQFVAIPPRQYKGWTRFPLAMGEPPPLGLLTPNDHSVTRGI